MIKYYFPYFGPLIIQTNLIKDQIKQVKKLCNKNVSNRRDLAGQIKDEFLIDYNKFDAIVRPQIETYKIAYNRFYGSKLDGMRTTTAWVNYMKAGEYNPPHIHDNCRFSCVLYLQVPKEIAKENKEYEGTSGGPGTIEFTYGETQPMDCNTGCTYVPKVGEMFIFPRFVRHSVAPFQSKVTRVSVAANFE